MNDSKNQIKNKEKARGIGGFMSGVLVLSLSTVIVKICGLAVKIPMLSTLGAVGMGYFNSAYEIYAMLCVISTAGLPVALSMLVSANRERGDMAQVRRIYRSALSLFLIMGAAGSAVMLLFAKQIAAFIGNADAYLCIVSIAPALFFVCFSSAVRGYFQGFENMYPTAISQLIESFGKLIFGVGFGVAAIEAGATLPEAAAMSVLGLSLGIVLSSVYLLIVKLTKRVDVGERGSRQGVGKAGHTVKMLLKIAVPITLSSAVLSACRMVDMALILRRLQSAGVSVSEANKIYGSYTTLAVPVFSLVPSLITPISLSLVPGLSAAIERGDKDSQAEIVDRSVRLTVLLSMPASAGLALYAKPILSILFSGESEAIGIAAPLLAILGMSVMSSGLITTTNAILQSYRQTTKPIISMSVGAAVKIVLAYVLIGVREIGIYGAPISTLICNLTITVINFRLLSSYIPKSKKSSGMTTVYLRPLAASSLAILASFAVYLMALNFSWSDTLAFVLALVSALILYVVFAICMGAVRKEDIESLPIGNKILKKIKMNK